MAGAAQAHEVRLIIRAAFRQGNDVVDFLDCDVASLLQAHLAERMLVDVACADALPRPSVSFASRVTARELLVVLLHQSFVLRAVLFAVLAQVRAALVAAGPLRFHWHSLPPPFEHKKSPAGVVLARLMVLLMVFAIVRITQEASAILCQSVPNRANFSNPAH